MADKKCATLSTIYWWKEMNLAQLFARQTDYDRATLSITKGRNSSQSLWEGKF